jgi:hypothetical protein
MVARISARPPIPHPKSEAAHSLSLSLPHADQGCDRDDDQAVDEHVGPLAALACQTEGEPGAGHDSGPVSNAMPADLEGAKGEGNRIGREGDHGRQGLREFGCEPRCRRPDARSAEPSPELQRRPD